MNKAEYLAGTQVQGFVQFLTKIIKGDPFHTPAGYRHKQWGKNVAFPTLTSALNGYFFPVKKQFHFAAQAACPCNGACTRGNARTCLAANNVVLDQLQKNLMTAHQGGNNEAIRKACIDIMIWGGTRRGNEAALNVADLNDDLANAKTYFADENIEVLPLMSRSEIACPRSNAGFTKIHSLFIPHFVIYDSRVAAALDWLVVQYLATTPFAGGLPDTLHFRRMTGRPGHQRDASSADYKFKSADNNHGAHAESNIMANWVICAALAQAGGEFCGRKGDAALRAIEAAMFVVGYDLPTQTPDQGNPDAVVALAA